jgi:hypothetical protein
VPRLFWVAALLVSALVAPQLFRMDGSLAKQEHAEGNLPGVSIETLGSAPLGDAELMLLRITVEPGASVPLGDSLGGGVVSLQSGSVGALLVSGEADLTLAGDPDLLPLTPGLRVLLVPGDALSFTSGTELELSNPGDTPATILLAALTAPAASDLRAASGAFSVETFACPVGMTLVTLETAACEATDEPLVKWSLASDQLDAPLGMSDATVEGAVTTWAGLPVGAYFVELTAEAFAPGYGDYFIPSSNQVTRQDARMTRIFYDSAVSRGPIRAYVFMAEPAE